MAWYRCGNKKTSLKDIFYNKVFNGGYTTYAITAYGSPARCTVNEGQVAVDTANKTVYVYVDLTVINENKIANDWWTVTYCGNLDLSYLPMGMASTTKKDYHQALITDENSPAYKPIIALLHDTTQGIVLMSPYGYGLTIGDRYIAYGSWQYL